MKKYVQEVKRVLVLSGMLLILCGIVYPLVMTGISQVAFQAQANGSLVEVKGQKVGSRLIGQAFTSAHFLKGRPSAVNYNTYTAAEKKSGDYVGVASGSDNLAATNPALLQRIQGDVATFLASHPQVAASDLPGDLFTASASGLDPHISPAAAELQVPQLALNTGLSEATLREIIAKNTSGKWLKIFGEETVNVLGVNLAIMEQLQ